MHVTFAGLVRAIAGVQRANGERGRTLALLRVQAVMGANRAGSRSNNGQPRGGQRSGGGGQRHGGGGYRSGHGGGGGGGGDGGAVAAGVIGGLLLGAIIANKAQRNQSANYCAQRYRSYDPRSGTFVGRDGNRYACP